MYSILHFVQTQVSSIKFWSIPRYQQPNDKSKQSEDRAKDLNNQNFDKSEKTDVSLIHYVSL